jgi:hydroxymethylbilane synthase
MAAPVLRVGARRSDLSRRQAAEVMRALRRVRPDLATRFVGISTAGDLTAAPLDRLAGEGVFASALQDALAAGRVDVAVHSLKDLPVRSAPGLAVAAVLARESPLDALVGSRLADLGPAARIGTGSPRRARQLGRLRPDLVVTPLRGNVPRRLAQVADGTVDAAVLAVAGLARLGLADRVTELLSPEVCLPAPGQGAIAVEAGPKWAEVVSALDHAPTRRAVTAERALLALLGGGCLSALGCLAEEAAGGALRLRARLVGEDGRCLEADLTGPADDLPERVAQALFAQGAAAVLGARPGV